MPYSDAPNNPSVTRIVAHLACIASTRKRRKVRMIGRFARCAALGFFKTRTPSKGETGPRPAVGEMEPA